MRDERGDINDDSAVVTSTVTQGGSIIRNVTWLGIATIAVKPIWFLFVTAGCMRVLGQAEYGYFTAILALAYISASFVDLGSGRYTIRAIVRQPAEMAVVVGQLLTLRALLSAASFVVCVVAAVAIGFSGDRVIGAMVASAYVLLLLATAYYRAIYQAHGDLRTEAVTLLVEKTAVVSFGLAGLLVFESAVGALGGMALGMAIGLMAAKSISDRRFVRTFMSLSAIPELPGIVKQVGLIGLTSLFAVIYLRTDLVMVEAILGDSAAGLYGAAFRIVEAFVFIPTIIASSALYPRLVKPRDLPGADTYGRTLKRGVAVLVAAGVTCCLMVAALAKPGLAILSGSTAFDEAAVALRILSVTLPFLFVNGLLYSALLGYDDERWLALCMMVVAILNIGGNLVLIPRLGIEGAAIATVVSEILLLLAYTYRMSVQSTAMLSTERTTSDVMDQP